MKITICDDEAIQVAMIKEYVSKWSNMNNHTCMLKTYSSADHLWFSFQEESDIDILLLDIQMDGMNGITLAKKIREINEKVVIIFITGVVDYIYDGFNVNALNYLLKPIKQDQLFNCLNKAVEQLEKEDHFICINVDKQVYKLNERKIRYIESIAHYIDIHYEDEVYHIKKNLTDMESELNSQMFYKVHRSFLVNMDFVERITKVEVILNDGMHLPIARGKWNNVNQAFIHYHMGIRI